MRVKKHRQLSGLLPPRAAHDTIRHELLVELEEGPLSARDLSGRIGIPEKDVYDHLTHIRTTLHRNVHRLVVQPAECAKCGFIFHKRERLTKPGKCPVCRNESIHEPLFFLTDAP
jgi:predicted Zn-ribbon and HTH transcriptional regulator